MLKKFNKKKYFIPALVGFLALSVYLIIPKYRANDDVPGDGGASWFSGGTNTFMENSKFPFVSNEEETSLIIGFYTESKVDKVKVVVSIYNYDHFAVGYFSEFVPFYKENTIFLTYINFPNSVKNSERSRTIIITTYTRHIL